MVDIVWTLTEAIRGVSFSHTISLRLCTHEDYGEFVCLCGRGCTLNKSSDFRKMDKLNTREVIQHFHKYIYNSSDFCYNSNHKKTFGFQFLNKLLPLDYHC